MPNQHSTDVAFQIVNDTPYDSYDEAATNGEVAVCRGEKYYAAKRIQ